MGAGMRGDIRVILEDYLVIILCGLIIVFADVCLMDLFWRGVAVGVSLGMLYLYTRDKYKDKDDKD
jgi:hypothetical protein